MESPLWEEDLGVGFGLSKFCALPVSNFPLSIDSSEPCEALQLHTSAVPTKWAKIDE